MHPRWVQRSSSLNHRSRSNITIHAHSLGATWAIRRFCCSSMITIHASSLDATSLCRDDWYANTITIHASSLDATIMSKV